MVVLQKVGHKSRIHLDIETDDLEAEAERLAALGAKRIVFVRERWWVMEAPTGHRFCVVRRQRVEFCPHLNTWSTCKTSTFRTRTEIQRRTVYDARP